MYRPLVWVPLCSLIFLIHNSGCQDCLGVPHHLACELSLSCMGKADMEHWWSVQEQLVFRFFHRVLRLVQHEISLHLIQMDFHQTNVINSLMDWVIRWVALLAFGEGWHNNHHAFEYSARHGLEWWQIDMTWYAVRFFQAIGLATDVKLPTEAQKERMAFSNGKHFHLN